MLLDLIKHSYKGPGISIEVFACVIVLYLCICIFADLENGISICSA